jgi:two-component system response regulator FixJ
LFFVGSNGPAPDLIFLRNAGAQVMTCNATIHIIDDNQAMLESLSLLLTTEGYSVRTYESARRFLDAIKHHACGCVVTDMNMPGMSGLDLLMVMKEQNISIPTIVITAVCDVRLSVNAMKLGACDFFEKPFAAEALLASIRSALMREPTCH